MRSRAGQPHLSLSIVTSGVRVAIDKPDVAAGRSSIRPGRELAPEASTCRRGPGRRAGHCPAGHHRPTGRRAPESLGAGRLSVVRRPARSPANGHGRSRPCRRRSARPAPTLRRRLPGRRPGSSVDLRLPLEQESHPRGAPRSPTSCWLRIGRTRGSRSAHRGGMRSAAHGGGAGERPGPYRHQAARRRRPDTGPVSGSRSSSPSAPGGRGARVGPTVAVRCHWSRTEYRPGIDPVRARPLSHRFP